VLNTGSQLVPRIKLMKLGAVRGKGGADRVAAAVGDSGRGHQGQVVAEGAAGNLTGLGGPGEVTMSGIGALGNPVEAP
jgi:hypothetical protein